MMQKIAAFCLAMLVGLGSASPALGFVLLGAVEATLDASPTAPTVQFRWNGTVPEKIEETEEYRDGAYSTLDDEQFFAQLLQDAVDVWNNVRGSYLIMEVITDTSVDLDTEDEVHAIVVESNDNISTAAFAQPVRDEDDAGIIRDCDISISDTETTAKELVYTIAHELGHCLGLGHSHSNYNALMGYSRDARSLALGADDIAGLIFLYPHPDFASDEVQELAGCSIAGQGASTQGSQPLVWLWLVLSLPLAIVVASRRNPNKSVG